MAFQLNDTLHCLGSFKSYASSVIVKKWQFVWLRQLVPLKIILITLKVKYFKINVYRKYRCIAVFLFLGKLARAVPQQVIAFPCMYHQSVDSEHMMRVVWILDVLHHNFTRGDCA